MRIILAVEKSQNKKTGLVSATYAPIQSCPRTCPFLNNGCYGQESFCGMHLKELNKAAKILKKETPVKIAKEEAKAIRELSGKYPLRLHVVGDCSTIKAAEIVSEACHDYMAKHNQPVWTYTHAWKKIPREIWNDISVLASCENEQDVFEAKKLNYASSIVRSQKKKSLQDKITYISCPNQTKGTTCDDCKLCFRDDSLRRKNTVISFIPHGSGLNKIKKVLHASS